MSPPWDFKCVVTAGAAHRARAHSIRRELIVPSRGQCGRPAATDESGGQRRTGLGMEAEVGIEPAYTDLQSAA